MGGGDLNLKKSWHPRTLRNQERVWREEKRVEEEQRKVEQLRKEKADEREREEYERLQERAGLAQPSRRLEWMYTGPASVGKPFESAADVDDDRTTYLLGKHEQDELLRMVNSVFENGDVDGVTTSTRLGSFEHTIELGNSAVNTERDIQAKMREDPLFAIRKSEQEKVMTLIENPKALRHRAPVAPSPSPSHRSPNSPYMQRRERSRSPRSSGSRRRDDFKRYHSSRRSSSRAHGNSHRSRNTGERSRDRPRSPSYGDYKSRRRSSSRQRRKNSRSRSRSSSRSKSRHRDRRHRR